MTFRIKRGESVEKAIQRIAREQLDKATGEIRDQDLDRHEAVHQVRKRCKKIRGLIRLVRPQFEDTYARENAWYRDSARRLSYVRDAQSIIETFDTLVEHYEDKIDRDAFSPIRRQLTKRRKKMAEDEVGLQEQLAEFLDRMTEGRERVAAWSLQDEGFDAVKGGLTKTYARGRAAMAKAYAEPSAESFHEWRKRAKYHWYHMRLISSIWKGPMNARQGEADRISDYLGDDHDLSILRETLLRRPDQFGGEDVVQTMIGLIAQRQVELRTRAKSSGARIFAEKPKRLAERLGRYWDAWADEGEVDPQATHAPKRITM